MTGDVQRFDFLRIIRKALPLSNKKLYLAQKSRELAGNALDRPRIEITRGEFIAPHETDDTRLSQFHRTFAHRGQIEARVISFAQARAVISKLQFQTAIRFKRHLRMPRMRMPLHIRQRSGYNAIASDFGGEEAARLATKHLEHSFRYFSP